MVEVMDLRRAAVIAFALSIGCSKSSVDCPEGSRMESGECRPVCAQDSECLAGERCDETLGVCIARGADAGESRGDARASDAEVGDGPLDAGRSRDGGAEDAGACGGLSQEKCMILHCEAHFCPSCTGGTQVYAGCTEIGGPAPACPGIACLPCSSYTDEMTCIQTMTCHAVFAEVTPCTCTTSGCCMHFVSCADGARAQCQGTPTCAQAPPVCDGDFRISYTPDCYEGCVRSNVCR
jgi:hypothetical protein